MNSITISLTLSTSPSTTYTVTGTAKTTATVKFGELSFKLEAWGDYMAKKLATIKFGTPVLVTGELHIIDRLPMVVATSVEVLPSVLPINTINLVGRTGRDAEVRYTNTGKAVGNVSLAVRRGKDNTDWFDLTLWDRTAAIACDYTNKGSLIGIQGKLSFDTWTDRHSGEQRVKAVIQVDRLELLGSRNEVLVAA